MSEVAREQQAAERSSERGLAQLPIDTSPRTQLLAALERALAPLRRRSSGPLRLIVAFSGGPDSLALLWTAAQLPPERTRPLAAHLDHALDPGSAGRAEHVARLARRLGVPCHCERRSVPELRRPGEAIEAAARRIRYAFLDEVATATDAHAILTAHHRDDQVETVLLRVAHGSGWAGLAAMDTRHGRILRPLLELPKRCLLEALSEAGLTGLSDPGNVDPHLLRNRLRRWVLPRLTAETPQLSDRLIRVADAARTARRGLARRFDPVLEPRQESRGASLDVAALRTLPPELAVWALGRLHRLAAAGGAPPAAATAELLRQLGREETATRCDCGDGWLWEVRQGRLWLEPAERLRPFRYTFTVPGRVWIAETGQTLRVGPAEPAAWMFRGAPERVGLALPLHPGDRVVVRTRQPGDRLRPLGAPGRRRLKEVLIDHGVPRRERDRLPLLVVGERIAWVPGVTIENAFRLRRSDEPASAVWVAELERQDSGMPSAATAFSLRGTGGQQDLGASATSKEQT